MNDEGFSASQSVVQEEPERRQEPLAAAWTFVEPWEGTRLLTGSVVPLLCIYV